MRVETLYSDWMRVVSLYSDWIRMVSLYSDWMGVVSLYSDWMREVSLYSDWVRVVFLYSDRMRVASLYYDRMKVVFFYCDWMIVVFRHSNMSRMSVVYTPYRPSMEDSSVGLPGTWSHHLINIHLIQNRHYPMMYRKCVATYIGIYLKLTNKSTDAIDENH